MSECTRKKTFCQVCGYRSCLERPPKGPVQILCEEIGFPFDRRLERRDLFVAFVGALVDEVDTMRGVAEAIVRVGGKAPSEGSAEALAAAKAMMANPTPASAALLHDACHRLNPDDAYPTDHLIDMLSSCASAIRFGLDDRDLGISSRHAAEAARHIWTKKYGISLLDGCTSAWLHDWARQLLMSAVLSLLPPEITDLSGAQRSELSPQAPDAPLPPSGVRDETDTLSRGSET